MPVLLKISYQNFKIVVDTKFPVIYYIHGGGNEYDTPRMFPVNPVVDRFASKEIIFAFVAYRLGPFGFWTLGTDENAGNMGMKG